MDHFGEHNSGEGRRDLLVIWRNEYVKAKYMWIRAAWPSKTDTLHKSAEALKENLHQLSKGALRLEKTATIVALTDENAPSWFSRMSRHIVRMLQTVWFHVTKDEALPVISVVGTIFFILFVGYFLNYLVANDTKAKQYAKEKPPAFSDDQKEWHPEDPRTPGGQRQSTKSSVSTKQKVWREMEHIIHELRAETYFGLIRLLKPGCRSIIILVDEDSKDVLLPQFARYVYPLRKY
ncbi:DnaJ domain-containing protein, partial [Aphelenchoides avenae]